MLKPRIKLSHQILKSKEGNLCIGEAGPNVYTVKNPPPFMDDLITYLDGSYTIPKIIKHLKNKYPQADGDEITNIIGKMHELHLLDDASLESSFLTSTEQELYNRQILLFSLLENKSLPGYQYQENIKNKHVAILGLGGWGTWLALNLCLAGVGEITIVDGDTVELSNLNRQVLYQQDDIGTYKAYAAQKKLQQINPYVKVNAYAEFVDKDDKQIEFLIRNKDLVFIAWANLSYYRKNCADEIIHKIAIKHRVPILEVNADPIDISVGPLYLNDGNSLTFFDIRHEIRQRWLNHKNTNVSEFRHARMVDSFQNGNRTCNAWQQASSLSAMAGIATSEAMKLLGEYAPPSLIGKEFALNLMTFQSQLIDFNVRIGKDAVSC